MSFNYDSLKEAHPTLVLNDNLVHQVALQKHLGMFLDDKLNFEEHLKTIVNKINKTIGLLRKLTSEFLTKKIVTYKI